MTLYRYQDQSPISSLHFRHNERAGWRALLEAAATTSPQTLGQIRSALAARGYHCTALTEDGRPQLEVRGFGDPHTLESALYARQFVTGRPTITREQSDKAELSWIQRNLQKITGIAYHFGDACYLNYTRLEWKDAKAEAVAEAATKALQGSALKKFIHEKTLGHVWGIVGGVGYALGPPVLSIFGNRDQSPFEIREICGKAASHLRQHGVVIAPQGELASSIAPRHQSWLGGIGRFLSRYPTEVFNVIYTITGGFITASSIRKLQNDIPTGLSAEQLRFHMANRKADIIDIGLGSMTLIASLFGLLVREQKLAPGEDYKPGLAGLWQRAQERPLAVQGALYGLSTGSHAVSTAVKYFKGDPAVRSTVIQRAIFVGMNVIAEISLFFGSKGHGVGLRRDPSIENTVVATLADEIRRAPKDKQSEMICHVSGYLSDPHLLGLKADEISSRLHAQLAAISNNPWTADAPATAPMKASTPSENPPQVAAAHAPGTTVSQVQREAQRAASPLDAQLAPVG